MAIAFVQYDDFKDVNPSRGAIANDTALNTTTGNLIVVCVSYWDATDTVDTVTDTEGNTYALAIAHKSGTFSNEIWYAKNITGNANNITTATFTANADYPFISVAEFSGADTASPLDDTSSNITSVTTNHTSGNATASTDGAVIVGVFTPATTSETWTVGAGFTDLASDTTNTYDYAEYKVLSSADDYAAICTTSNNASVTCTGAIFKATGVVNVTVEPSAEALSLTLQTPSVSGDANVSPSSQTLTLGLQVPDISSDADVSPSALSLALTLPTPDLEWSSSVSPTALTLTETLQTPTLVCISSVSPSALDLALTLPEPSIFAGALILPSALALTLTQGTHNVILGPNIGYTPIGGNASSTIKGWAEKVTMPENGRVFSASVYCSNTTGSSVNMQIGFYNDDAGSLGTLIWHSENVAVENNFSGWKEIEVSETVDFLDGVDYWLAVQTNGAIEIYYDVVARGSELVIVWDFGDWSDNPAWIPLGTISFSMFARYYDLETVSPSVLELALDLLNPIVGSIVTISPDILELTLSLLASGASVGSVYQPLNLGFGYHDGTASGKPDGISLFWKGRIVDEEHYEPHLTDGKDFSNLHEIPERLQQTRGAVGEVTDYLTVPLMPTIKRRRDNQLAMFLENNTLHNKTEFVRDGVKGAKYGEGVDSGERLLSKWKETHKTKD